MSSLDKEGKGRTASQATYPTSQFEERLVWDLPTRAFHWLLAGSVIAGWYLGYNRTFTTIDWHFYLGYFTAGLLVFRLVWGFVGPPASRFVNIVPSPAELMAYIKTIGRAQPSGTPGHNPLGGLSVIALLAVLSVQVTTGLFAEDDGLFAEGPLSSTVSNSWVLFANQVHYYSSRILLGLVILHLTAIFFYHIWKREDLIGPMMIGLKLVRRDKSLK